MNTTAIVRRAPLDLVAFSRATGLHPDVVRRIVDLGLLEPSVTASGELTFTPQQIRLVARLQRLRAGFSLNYAALGLVVHLLERIDELESVRSRSPYRRGGPSWT